MPDVRAQLEARTVPQTLRAATGIQPGAMFIPFGLKIGDPDRHKSRNISPILPVCVSQILAFLPRAGWDITNSEIKVRFTFLWKGDMIT